MICYAGNRSFSRGKSEKGIAVLAMVLVLAILGLGFVYLAQTNKLVSGNYRIREYQERLSRLRTENQRLEELSVETKAPANLDQIVSKLGMVPAGRAIYLEPDRLAAVKASHQ